MSVPATAPVWTYQHTFAPMPMPLDTVDRSALAAVEQSAIAAGGGRRGPALGVLALLLALLAAGVEIGGIVASLAGDYAAGTVLAIVAIVASAAAVVIGIVAVVRRAGRPVAIVGAILGLLVNPLVLVTVLGAIAEASVLG